LKNRSISSSLWANKVPAVLSKGAIPEQVSYIFFLMGTLIEDTIIGRQDHILSFQQISSVESIMDQEPEEEFMLWLTRRLPNPDKVRVHLLKSHH
jgi:hypothetical protein